MTDSIADEVRMRVWDQMRRDLMVAEQALRAIARWVCVCNAGADCVECAPCLARETLAQLAAKERDDGAPR